MITIIYDIQLNEDGRPYIHLPEDYEQKPEDRFFALEIARYILRDLLERNNGKLDNNSINALDESERLLGQLGDEVAELLYGNMRSMGDMKIMMDERYHLWVHSIEERDNLPDTNIVYMNMIFDRVEGLRVGVNSYYENGHPAYDIYELQGGISNENWVKL